MCSMTINNGETYTLVLAPLCKLRSIVLYRDNKNILHTKF